MHFHIFFLYVKLRNIHSYFMRDSDLDILFILVLYLKI